jgi:MFS family permease
MRRGADEKVGVDKRNPSSVTTTFTEGAERNKALGIWGALAGAGGAAGVLLGGVLTSGLGWEWVLFVNAPIGAAAIFFALRLVKESYGQEETSMDVAGAVTVTGGLVTLVYALVDAHSAGWGSLQTVGLLALSAVLLASFVAIELRTRHPVMPLRIFRNRSVASADAVAVLVGASLFAMFFFISLYGGALGLAVLSTVAASRTAAVGGEPLHALTEGFQSAFAVGAGFAVVGILLTLGLVPHIRHDQLPQEAPAIA